MAADGHLGMTVMSRVTLASAGIPCNGATEIAGQENAGLEIDGQKLHGVKNDGHSIKG